MFSYSFDHRIQDSISVHVLSLKMIDYLASRSGCWEVARVQEMDCGSTKHCWSPPARRISTNRSLDPQEQALRDREPADLQQGAHVVNWVLV